MSRLNHAILHDESLTETAYEAVAAFKQVETVGKQRPIVGVVGEIYLRNNRFSNNYLIQKLEKLGLEVRLATFAEWPLYTSYTYRRDARANRDFKAFFESNIQIFSQERMEHKIFSAFRRKFDIVEDLHVGHVMKLASRYLPLDFKGEAVLSIGKAIEMVRDGACGIINAMPFNCMPGTIVSSLSKQVSEDLGRVPWLNMSYEGLRDSGEETRLEAFAEQVHSFARNAQVAGYHLTAKE